MADLISQIKKEKEQNLQIIADTRKLRAQELQRVEENKELEAHKWEEFKTLIEGKEFFRMSHIDALNIDYDIVIHLSAKGSGKTTETFRIMERCLEKGEKFMYGRVYQNELDAEIAEFNMDDRCPVYAISFKGVHYLFEKGEINDWMDRNQLTTPDGETIRVPPTFKKCLDAGFRNVGRCYTFMKSNSLSGGTYEDYTTIIFDEILSYAPVNRINDRILKAWGASIHTIQRNKTGLKVYMFGNLQDLPSHPILNFYGIDMDDNLRIINRGENGETKILYINSGGLYLNTIGNKGGAAHHAGIEHGVFLKHNKSIKPTGNIIGPPLFGEFKYDTAFAVMCLDRVLYVELRTFEYFNAIRCYPLELTTIMDGEIYTNDPVIYNSYLNTTKRLSIESIFNVVYRHYRNLDLYFDTVQSLQNYALILKYYSGLLYENQPNPCERTN